MRRTPYALGGLLIIALGALIGFAAFSADGASVPTTLIEAELPDYASGRIAAAAFADLVADDTLDTGRADARSATQSGPASGVAAQTDAPAPTTSTAPPTTTTIPPSTTTTTTPPPVTTTTTTTSPPPTTTTTTTTTPPPTTTTTTQPPVEGGARDVEEWRTLVETYFPAERVEEALSVMYCESRGNPLAVNDISGAAGLFQFVPNTWGWASSEAGWGGASVFDPDANTAAAAWLVATSIATDHPGGAWGHWSCQP